MKKWLFAIGISLFIAFNLANSPFFPTGYENVFIDMSRDSLIKVRGNHFTTSKLPNGNTILTEGGSADSLITKAMYFITPSDTLYEVVIEFADYFDLEKYMKDTYGTPNVNGEEWLKKLENGKELYIWQYQNRLCIARGDLYR